MAVISSLLGLYTAFYQTGLNHLATTSLINATSGSNSRISNISNVLKRQANAAAAANLISSNLLPMYHSEADIIAQTYVYTFDSLYSVAGSYGSQNHALSYQNYQDVHGGWMCYHWATFVTYELQNIKNKLSFWGFQQVGIINSNNQLLHNFVEIKPRGLPISYAAYFDAWADADLFPVPTARLSGANPLYASNNINWRQIKFDFMRKGFPFQHGSHNGFLTQFTNMNWTGVGGLTPGPHASSYNHP